MKPLSFPLRRRAGGLFDRSPDRLPNAWRWQTDQKISFLQSGKGIFPATFPRTGSLKVLSWNLLHTGGATLEDIFTLIHLTSPDILVFQEAREFVDILPDILGGYYIRTPIPDRPYGLVSWSRLPFAARPELCQLPSGLMIRRNCQITHFQGPFGLFSLANVHLSHGQILNRRQLKIIRKSLSGRAIITGDFNLVGPLKVSGFQQVGPKADTHLMLRRVPLRLDRCLARGLIATEARTLPRFGSDHAPILMTLNAPPPKPPKSPQSSYKYGRKSR